MKLVERYSDELLNAYLDGELDTEEQKRLIEDLNTDPYLNQRVCELARIRSMVRFAYHDVPEMQTPSHPTTPLTRRNRMALVSVLTLTLGISVGWMASQYNKPTQGLLELANHVELNNKRATAETWRVMLHLTTDNPTRLKVVLDETETLLNQYAHNKQPLQMEILANGKGLNLLRADTSEYGQRIRDMQQRYENLVFVACGTALKRLQEEKNLNVQLLPDVDITPSAIGEVLKKQGEGWTYIQI